MKIITLSLFALFFSVKGFTQTEEIAIKKVLNLETTSFFKHDFKEAYAKWHLTPQSVMLVSHLDGNVLNLTDKELNEAYTSKELSAATFPDTFERSDWKFRIKEATAYVTFNQTVAKDKKITGRTHEARYMEKVSGQWKIVSSTVMEYKN